MAKAVKEWVAAGELRENNADLSNFDDLQVRFPRGWWCNMPPGSHIHIPLGMERGPNEPPVMEWSGGFYQKYNPSDERTVFEFPVSWLSRLPKTAQINMGGTWAARKEAIKEAREGVRPPMTLAELRQTGAAGTTGVDASPDSMRMLADKDHLAQLQAEVDRRVEEELAKRDAEAAVAKELLKRQRLENLAKAREKKKNAKRASS